MARRSGGHEANLLTSWQQNPPAAQIFWLPPSARVSRWDPLCFTLELTTPAVSDVFVVGKKQCGKKCLPVFNHKNCNVTQQWRKLLTSAKLDGRDRRPQFSLSQSGPAATHLRCHNHTNCVFSYLQQLVCVFVTSSNDCLFCLSASSNMTCECGSIGYCFA